MLRHRPTQLLSQVVVYGRVLLIVELLTCQLLTRPPQSLVRRLPMLWKNPLPLLHIMHKNCEGHGLAW
jgi:hypothetical protein